MGRRQFVEKNKKPLIVICSEGGNNTSEKVYFSNFKSRDIRIQFSTGNSTDPDGMLNDLLKYIRNEDIKSEDKCSIFLLIDTDLNEDRIKKIKQIEEECRMNDISIITSSPTFEIWYLMHFTNKGLNFSSSQDVKKELSKLLDGKYTESLNIFSKINNKKDNASKTALKILDKSVENGEDIYFVNPHTFIYKVIDKIEEYKNKD